MLSANEDEDSSKNGFLEDSNSLSNTAATAASNQEQMATNAVNESVDAGLLTNVDQTSGGDNAKQANCYWLLRLFTYSLFK